MIQDELNQLNRCIQNAPSDIIIKAKVFNYKTGPFSDNPFNLRLLNIGNNMVQIPEYILDQIIVKNKEDYEIPKTSVMSRFDLVVRIISNISLTDFYTVASLALKTDFGQALYESRSDVMYEQVTDNVYQLMTRLDMETDSNKIDTEYLKVMESYKIYL